MSRQVITPNQISKIHTLLSKLDLMDEKRDLVQRFSAGRCTSTRDLLSSEAEKFIEALVDQVPGDGGEARDRMVKKMLYYGYQMGFDQPRYDDQKGMKASKINFQNVDAWCRSDRSKFKKGLNDMDFTELRITLSQFERMYVTETKDLAN